MDDDARRSDDKADGHDEDAEPADERGETDAVSETAVAETPWWITDPCPTWCNGEHEADGYDEDRAHFSETVDVPVIQAGSPPYRDGDDAGESAEYYIVMRRYMAQREIWVYIGDGERNGLEITLESAARLGWALRRLSLAIGPERD